MNGQKKHLIYYNESLGIIGVREHHFDWEEGEDIMTNGVKTTIFAIFEGTERNLRLANNMMNALSTRLSRRTFDAKLDYIDGMLLKFE